MIEYVKKKRLSLEIDTNSSFNPKNIKILAKVDSFIINLSASMEKTYRKLQCSRLKSFQNVVSNIEILSRIKKIKGKPKIKIAYLINTFNFLEIQDIIKLAKKYEIDNIKFTLIFALPEMKGLVLSGDNIDSLHLVLKSLDNQKDPFLQRTNLQELRGIISNMRSHKHEIIYLPHQDNDEMRIFYYKRNFGKNFRCYIGWYNVTVNFEGEVYPCCHHNSLSGGNIYDTPLRGIWFGEKFSSIRSKLKYSFDINDKFWQRCHYCSEYDLMNEISQRLRKKGTSRLDA